MMKTLFVSNLFPDTGEPLRGLDNAVLLRYLRSHGEVRVLAPRPVLPLLGKRDWEPRAEDESFSPQYVPTYYVPRAGSRWNHRLMASALREPLRRAAVESGFDAVLCSWLYPDGCAVARLARELDFPFVMVCQGSDAHQYLRNATRKAAILDAIDASSGVITRSADLATLLRDHGADSEKLEPIYNGVDLEVFRPGDAGEAKRRLGLNEAERLLLFVGNLYPVKNPALMIEAFCLAAKQRPRDEKWRLAFVGDGYLRQELEALAERRGCSGTIEFVGRKPPVEVACYMQAADLLCMTSLHEGLPNVILEAFGCGLPVVSTDVGGIHEVLNRDFLGERVEPGNAEAFAEAIGRRLAKGAGGEGGAAATIREYALGFSWENCAAQYAGLLQRALAVSPAPAAEGAEPA